MALYACFFDSSDAQSLAAAWSLKYSSLYGSTTEFYDTKAKDEAGMTTLIGTLTPDAYTKIFVLVGNAAAHVAGDFTDSQLGLLDGYLITANKGTATANVVATGTAQANSTVTLIKLASADTAADSFYVGMWIVTAGVTAVTRAITAYTSSTKLATVVSTGTAITTTETYKIFQLANVLRYGVVSAAGKTVAQQTFEALYPNTALPVLIQNLTLAKIWNDYGTAQSAGATSILIAASAGAGAITARATNVFVDYYVFIYSSTLGKNQYRKISAYNNSNQTCTVATWTTTPTGTIVYRVTKYLYKVFADLYTEWFVKTYFKDLTDVTAYNDFVKMIDKGGTLNEQNRPWTEQDLSLLDAYLLKGKAIQDYVGL